MSEEFFVIDMRTEWARKPYITVWRPENCGYAYPLTWAGRYRFDELKPSYHDTKQGTARWKRFPVPCEVAERLAIAPEPGMIDGDAGPVIPNTREARRALLAARLRLSDMAKRAVAS